LLENYVRSNHSNTLRTHDTDLQALLADKNTAVSITPTPTMIPEPTPTPEVISEPEKKKSGAGGVIFLIILLAALGGGAYYYFKVFKPKQNTAKTTVNTEYDELDFEDENSENDAEMDVENYGIRSEIPEFEPFSEPLDRGSGREKPRRSVEYDFDKMLD